jgi:hypothetical protein
MRRVPFTYPGACCVLFVTAPVLGGVAVNVTALIVVYGASQRVPQESLDFIVSVKL